MNVCEIYSSRPVSSPPASDPTPVVNATIGDVYDQVIWKVQFNIFLIWEEETGIGIQLFVLFVLLSIIKKKLLNISIVASRTPASGRSFTTAKSAGCPAPPTTVVPPSGPNSNPLDLFPQGLPDMGTNAPVGVAGNLDFLRNSPHECFDSKQFQDHHSVEESWDAGFNDDWNIGMLEELKVEDSEGIIGSQSHVEKSLDKLNARNQILRDQFGIDIEAKGRDEGF
ncbi:unnamed protein product [Lactuca saligna]|uniref:Uncharacterized protein n=1 Tax=Lactuca saligna TaxID=75948 RepID=A0AA35Z7X8_LACSI|nr:unnamed protein product [Lactuca saligna]